MPTIHVELFGILRRRAGTDRADIELKSEASRLGDVVQSLADRFPSLADECLDGRRLGKGYLASVDGNNFITDPSTHLPDGASLLIMPADAGG